ncbi:hypothetical protein [Puniceicoccus vermicola]|uniref:Uncharacterized protein n=1 Tax=Puniceicoccus vermicola TaxID=388746 RepID=A0A7X1AXL5_9BACT|nr:hypothetical protein [Puniceicoccus vermicola]MBC2601629.1 hypothetical protein [Puniceicoccus vermicola]
MNDLTNSLALLGKPYTLTKSRIGAVTKVFSQVYLCDPRALKELFDKVNEKLGQLNPSDVKFSFLISYSDKTHHDGVVGDLQNFDKIATGKQTERVVLHWAAEHLIDGHENETSITVRISNPINPLVFLQAALSKSPNDIDNLEFEMGSTCATVNGSGQIYAEEVFHSINLWVEARNKPHPFMSVHRIYGKYEWLIDQLSLSILPILVLSGACAYFHALFEEKALIALAPVLFGGFMILRDFGRGLNSKMAYWANKSKFFSVFQLTNGDDDALAKVAASSKNSCIKLGLSAAGSLILNVLAGIICFYLLKS